MGTISRLARQNFDVLLCNLDGLVKEVAMEVDFLWILAFEGLFDEFNLAGLHVLS